MALGACQSVVLEQAPPVSQPDIEIDLPAMRHPAPQNPVPVTRSNHDMVQDFLDLSFEMESGHEIQSLSRFEGAITLRVLGAIPPTLEHDLSILLNRLRSEANVNIRRVAEDEPASITISTITTDELHGVMPGAACFVAPRVSTWEEFRQNRRRPTLDWTTLDTRETVSIFLPHDQSPQEIRDCLHEELAQALGPLNDLYRLTDSVFNDDNFHTVLTGFDMLMLRVYYAPEMHSGMSRAEAEVVVPAILRRYNPAGENGTRYETERSSRDWVNTVLRAIGAGTSDATRRRSAERAIAIAERSEWADNRLAFSHYLYGLMMQPISAEASYASLLIAHDIYSARRHTRIHAAYVSAQLAMFEIRNEMAPQALSRLDEAIATAQRHENAALTSTLYFLKAKAQEVLGRPNQATLQQALAWGQYGFRDRAMLLRHMAEIQSL